MDKITIVFVSIMLLSIGLAIYFYPLMPDLMASHWNFQGEVDDYMPKFWALFIGPIVLSIMMFLFCLIPRIDPLKKNIKKFKKYFELFILLILLFTLYLQVLMILWGLGYTFNMGSMMIPALSLLFYFIGVMLGHAKRNWFIGIRTPWTMSNDKVWNKTHKLGGKLFKLAAIISLIGLVFINYAIYFMLIPILSVAFYLVAYSYLEFKKL